MPVSIRPAIASDLPQMADLLLADAEQRRLINPSIWSVAHDAREKIASAVQKDLEGADPSDLHIWLVAEASGRSVGIAHAMILPVPPIYAGPLGAPGLILDDCFTTADAPPDTAEVLMSAVEAALHEAGARLLVASCPVGSQLRPVFETHGYEPVTLYMTKAGFDAGGLPSGVRPATSEDVPGIVTASARHRHNLERLDSFWTLHPEADLRFGRWMQRSLTLADRDMLVSGPPGEVRGYVIAQPVARLLVPAAHEIGKTGVLDDYYHEDFVDTTEVVNCGSGAADLLLAAECAFARRDFKAALVVCPAAWRSKISVLESNSYRTAKIWMVKR